MEKTRITHLNEGFKFLGFEIERSRGHNGMKTKVQIPKEAAKRLSDKVAATTDSTTHDDSVNAKLLALNRIITASGPPGSGSPAESINEMANKPDGPNVTSH